MMQKLMHRNFNSPAALAAHPRKSTPAAVSSSMPVTLSSCLQLSCGP